MKNKVDFFPEEGVFELTGSNSSLKSKKIELNSTILKIKRDMIQINKEKKKKLKKL